MLGQARRYLKIDLPNPKRQRLETSDFNFTTPTLGSQNKNEYLTTWSSERNYTPSFKWDIFSNYGLLSNRRTLFDPKPPLNFSQATYGGNFTGTYLFKTNTPAITRKIVIPINLATNGEIRTTSSILMNQISSKNKEIKQNKYIIRPRVRNPFKKYRTNNSRKTYDLNGC